MPAKASERHLAILDQMNRSELEARFLAHVQVTDGCWLWTAEIIWNGYGRLLVNRVRLRAHRVSYFLYRGALDSDRHIDHLCKNRRCVNPHHLELVVPRTNIVRGDSPAGLSARRQTCFAGHPYDRIASDNGQRYCHTCKLIKQRARRAAQKVLANA